MKANFDIGKNRPNGVNFELISDESARMIDNASRDILASYGVKVTDADARKIFKDAGCDVNEETFMVKIPNHIINQAISSVPSRFTIYGRGENSNVVQESRQKISNYTTFGCGLEFCRYLGDGKFETKDSTDADLATAAKMCDWAENIDIVTTSIQSRDWVGKGNDDVHQLLTLLKNTTKHVHHINPVGSSVDYYWEIVKAYYDGDEELARSRPIFSVMACATSPLEIGANDAQTVIRCAKYGIPVVCQTMALAGATGPGYLAGSVVVTNCEVLAQLVLGQLVRPGLPMWYASTTSIIDMYDSTAPMGNPEIAMICAACSKLAAAYDIPMWSAGMWSDSKVPDAQAAAEKTLTSFVDALAGASMIYGCGSLELGSTFSPEQLVIDDAIISTQKMVLNGIEVNEETCSVELIKKIGACGDFLAEPSTMETMEKFSHPWLFDRSLINSWREAGSKNIIERAHEIVEDVLANHVVEPIAADKLEKMEAVAKAADEVALKKLVI